MTNSSSARRLTPEEQFAALVVLDCFSDLVTIAENDSFTKTEVLILIDLMRSHEEVFDREVVIAQQEATRGIGE